MLLYHAPLPVPIPELIGVDGQEGGQQLAAHAPHGGDLLRALRVRRGWSQERVAAALGVPQSQIARWEKGLRWPDVAHLHSLCRVLNAHHEELVALTTGKFALGESDEVIPDFEATEKAFIVVNSWPVTPEKAALMDLMYLDVVVKAWRSALRYPRGMVLLVDIYAVYAERLFQQMRYREAIAMATRALDIATQTPNCAHWPRALIRLAEARTEIAGRAGAKQGVARLKHWLPAVGALRFPQFSAWPLSTMARLLSRTGSEKGIAVAQEAIQVAECWDSPAEVSYRRLDYVETLLNLGKPEVAREEVATLDANLTPVCLHQAEIYRQLGNHDEALHWLHRARQNLMISATTDAHLVPYYIARIEGAATLLAGS